MKTFSSYMLLIILCLALYLPGIASIPLIDRDSAHFAQASRQMILDHDYWNIRFQNTPRHLKPPGIYWLHTMSVKLFSSADSRQVWPYTLVSVAGGLFAVLLTFMFTRRVYDNSVALLAAALLAASPLLVIESHLIVTDSTLLATMVLMQGALWQLYLDQRAGRPSHWIWALLFWLGMAAGILIKGITPLVAVLTIIAICIIDRNIRWLKYTRFYWGLPLVMGLTLAWLVPLSVATESNFLADMWRQDALPKLMGGQESHGMLPGFYLLIFTLAFWPAALFIWHTINWSRLHRMQPAVRFLLAWIIPTWLFFELTPTKLPEYVLPVFPALAVLTAQAVLSAQQVTLSGIWRWLARLQYCFWVLIGFMMLDFISMMPHHFDHRLLPSSMIAVVCLGITLLLALILLYRKQYVPVAWVNIIGMVLVFGITLQFIIPQVHALWVSQKVVTAIAAQQEKQDISATNPLLTIGYGEPSLVFLLGGDNVISSSAMEAVLKLQQQPIHLVLVEQSQVQQLLLLTQQAQIGLKLIATIRGFDYSKGHWVTLMLFKRGY